MRLLIPLQLILVGVLLQPVLSKAAVTGKCTTCHTMHNSQNNSSMVYTMQPDGTKLWTGGAKNNLTVSDCMGCHTNSGTDTIVTIGATRIPIVFNTSAPTYPPVGTSSSVLAGGNFYWVANNGDQYGHNIAGINGQDARLATPPGNHNSCGGCHTSLAVSYGCEGCHVAQHHADDSATVVGQTGGWYRFLGSSMWLAFGNSPPSTTGVQGIGDEDWERSPSSTNHNSYYGASSPPDHAGFSYIATSSISQKCQGCHGNFHESAYLSSSGVWIRHPVDVVIPNSGEFTGYTTYNPMVPVARPNLAAGDKDDSTVNLGSDVVSCISCHRAHGSPYPAMLRWDYRGWPASGATDGCHVCHTSKD